MTGRRFRDLLAWARDNRIPVLYCWDMLVLDWETDYSPDGQYIRTTHYSGTRDYLEFPRKLSYEDYEDVNRVKFIVREIDYELVRLRA